MTISVKHTFQSAKPDGADATLVQPSNWNDEHVLTLATNKLLGRATAGTGAVEEIGIGTALSMSGGTLAVTTVPVANGGTGATSLTANNVLLGNGTSALQAVAPSTSGNVLTSNGTTWVSQAPVAATTTYEKITAVNASGASSVDFTGLSSTYSQYMVVVTNMTVSRSGGAYVDIRVSQDNGSSYNTSGYAYSGATFTSGGSVTGAGSSSAASINLPLIYSNSPTNSFLTFTVTNAGVSGYLTVQGFGASGTDSCEFVGIRNAATTVNAIRIFSTSTAPSATFTGTFTLYGIRA